MKQQIIDHFFSFYKISGDVKNKFLSGITPRIIAEQNMVLLAPYTKEEVKDALFSMHLDEVGWS